MPRTSARDASGQINSGCGKLPHIVARWEGASGNWLQYRALSRLLEISNSAQNLSNIGYNVGHVVCTVKSSKSLRLKMPQATFAARMLQNDAVIVALTSVMHIPRIAPCAAKCSARRVLPSINGQTIPRSRNSQNIQRTTKDVKPDSDPAPQFSPIPRLKSSVPKPRPEHSRKCSGELSHCDGIGDWR